MEGGGRLNGSYIEKPPPCRCICKISTSDLGIYFFYLGPKALGKKIYPSVIGGYLCIYTSKEVVILHIKGNEKDIIEELTL